MKKSYKHKQLLEDIYDYLKECRCTAKDGAWAKLSQEHASQARKDLRKFFRTKSMEWDPANNTIKIGRDIILQLEVKR